MYFLKTFELNFFIANHEVSMPEHFSLGYLLRFKRELDFFQFRLSKRFFFLVRSFFPILRFRLMLSNGNQIEDIFPVAVITIVYKIPFSNQLHSQVRISCRFLDGMMLRVKLTLKQGCEAVILSIANVNFC